MSRAPQRLGAGALVAVLLGAAGPAWSEQQSPGQRLQAIEREIRAIRGQDQTLAREGEQLRREIAVLRGRAIAAAAQVQELESRSADIAADIASIAARAASLRVSIERRRATAAHALATLARLSRLPPELVAFAPDSPLDTLRGARLAAGLVPAMAAEVRQLGLDIAEAERLADELRLARAALAEAEAERVAERDRLAALVSRRVALDAANAEARAAAANAIAERVRAAADLREALGRPPAPTPRSAAERRAALDAARAAQAAAERERAAARPPAGPGAVASGLAPAGDHPARFADARGRLLPPVRGRIVGAFGQPDDAGQPNRGIAFETAEQAQVVAPFAGQVMFAGPFRSYGLVLIIDHGEGYHSVLLGLARIDATVGQGVAAGEPVGVADATGNGRPGIYLELRRAGQPIDPAGWLAAVNRGESG
ncbi:MAG: peptidoglycan DD-metalloendopeptidase family protein [Alphaproteobacteria bacterium]|nr:peptidoglycan DD-metalloendopeptidase family protein [Alphaproteobacteria bacterium]